MLQPVFYFGTVTVTADAAARTLADLITTLDFPLPFGGQTGACVSLNFYADKDIVVGSDGQINADPADGGAVLQANTPFTDSATGMTGNVIPLGAIYVYSASTDATVTIFLRSLP